MKKTIIFILFCVILFLSIFANAESHWQTEDGVQWGDSINQIKAQFGTPIHNYIRDKTGYISYFSTYSKYQSKRSFMFCQDKLYMIYYWIQNQNVYEAYRYLSAAISSVYGENRIASCEEIARCINISTSASADDISDAIEWDIDNQTKIWLFFEKDVLVVCYVNSNVGLAEDGAFDTTGI